MHYFYKGDRMKEKPIQFNVKLTQEELQKIDANARKANMSRSAFVRLVALNSVVKIVPDESI
jgi:hypothetical protein